MQRPYLSSIVDRAAQLKIRVLETSAVAKSHLQVVVLLNILLSEFSEIKQSFSRVIVRENCNFCIDFTAFHLFFRRRSMIPSDFSVSDLPISLNG